MKRSTRILALSVSAHNAGVSRHSQTAVVVQSLVILAHSVTDFRTLNIAEQYVESNFTLWFLK